MTSAPRSARIIPADGPMTAWVSAWSIYKLFDTSDDQKVFIGIISEKHWAQFCEIFERKDWIEDERLATNNRRIDEREWFLPEVEKMIRQYTKDEVIRRCDTAGICFAPIARPEDLFEDPQLNQGAGLIETTFPSGEKTKMPRLPIQIGDYQFDKRSDPQPVIGVDTQEVLEAAGFSKDEIASLAEENVIAVGQK